MLRSKLASTLALPALGLAVAQAVDAQEVASPYRFIEHKQNLGPIVSYLFTDRGTAKLGPKSGLAYGLQYSIQLSGPIRLSAYGAYFPTQRDVIDPKAEDEEARVLGSEDLDLVLLGGRLQLNLPGARTWNRLAPFVLAGLGVAMDPVGDIGCTATSERPHCLLAPTDRFKFGTAFIGQLGVGTIWLPGQRIGVRLSAVNTIWRVPAPLGFSDVDVTLDPRPPSTDWTNNIHVTLGLSYWF
jgi:hypothetical protein